MLNVFIADYTSWPVYDSFLIVLLLGWPIYDPNSLRPNPNPKKPVSSSCRVRGLDRTLTPLEWRELLYYVKSSRKQWSVLGFFVELVAGLVLSQLLSCGLVLPQFYYTNFQLLYWLLKFWTKTKLLEFNPTYITLMTSFQFKP